MSLANRTAFRIGLGLTLLAIASTSHAAVFCADTPAGIAGAMDTAKANGQDDEIRIVAGLYLLDATLRLGNTETEAFALAFSGRWNANCSEQSAGSASSLSGRRERPILVLSVDAGASIRISDLAFTDGAAAFNVSGSVLDISGSSDVVIERSQFYLNDMRNGEPPVAVSVGGAGSTLSVNNNLVFDNSANAVRTGIYLSAQLGTAYVTGNTITTNASTVSCPCSALNYSGTSTYTLSNNIVWNNDGGDVFINAVAPTHLDNDIGVLALGGNAPGPGSAGNLSVDPVFDTDGVHLLAESPLVNAGLAAAPGGIGDLDGGRGERRIGASVDIGAFETDVLFRNGFD